MSLQTLTTIYFSPTKSTKKVVDTIAKRINANYVQSIDLTLPKSEQSSTVYINAELAIIGVPVYSGRVPLVALQRLKKIQAENVPAVVVVVYGNRHYDDALLELKDIAVDSGFKPIAAGAFIAQHSFSLEEYPIAQSRPDSDDLLIAEKLADQVLEYLKSEQAVESLATKSIPGNFPYLQRKALPPFAPGTDKDKCGNCRKCSVVCPTGAISKRNNSVIDEALCILCGACVKACESGARTFNQQAFIATVQKMSPNLQIQRQPELFFTHNVHRP